MGLKQEMRGSKLGRSFARGWRERLEVSFHVDPQAEQFVAGSPVPRSRAHLARSLCPRAFTKRYRAQVVSPSSEKIHFRFPPFFFRSLEGWLARLARK